MILKLFSIRDQAARLVSLKIAALEKEIRVLEFMLSEERLEKAI